MEKHVFEYIQGTRKFVAEIGEIAKQANGAVMMHFGDTMVVSAAVMSNDPVAQDFFPLTILYQEKLYAAGKIPGGFLKREGRPTEKETLTARLIDRPIRPLFAEGFRNEVQVVNMVVSADPDCSSQMAAMLGASLSLCISDIPFDGPIAGVVVGRVDGEFVLNPTPAELDKSDINLIVAGTEEAINMVEAGSKEVSEEDMVKALEFGHAEVKRLCRWQKDIVAAIGKPKVTVTLKSIPEEIKTVVYDHAYKDMVQAVIVKDKLARYAAIDKVEEDTVAYCEDLYQDDADREEKIKAVNALLDIMVSDEVRRLIIDEKIRPDGRKVDEIRPLSCRVDVLPRAHGSALFTRGQTQSLASVTLGSLSDDQIIEGIGLETNKRFMMHYNFPAFSVGETGRYGSPGRREIGHGALGERALSQVIPNEDEFPYTIRVVSEILESNGSSSQASICAGCMALMAAGVPIKAPVAGIAMGLISDEKNYTILTDIQGMEDHYGDMDFKVAGTRDGICALQMDIKVKGISYQILAEALAQAKRGRMTILDAMQEAIPEVRKELSPYAPKVVLFYIKKEKIREVIGGGGKTINEIIEKCGNVKVDIEETGRITIMHTDQAMIDKARGLIEDICREAEVGKIYDGKVTRIEAFGAFVQLWPGCEGLLHISRISDTRVEKVEDVLALGDIIAVRVTDIDEKGRVNLTHKNLSGDKPDAPMRPKSSRPFHGSSRH